ncbi:MAG: Smr/MutS family protein [Deltaproteobacteria bacterium]|nr:Smr/MutS family protein [Deltaproteobacteria bacterium]
MTARNLVASAALSLEWQVVVDALQARAVTSQGRRLLAALGPLPTRTEVERSLALVEELRGLRRSGSFSGVGGIEEVDELLVRASKDGALLPLELLQIGRTLDGIDEVRRNLQSQEDRAPLAWELVAAVGDHRPLARAIERTFDPAGRIVDDASADLPELRRRAARLREEIKATLGELVTRLDRAEVLQEGYYTLRNDRYVLPVRSDRRGQIDGIVHDTSNSGQTLFVEPQPLVDAGNRLKIAEAAVHDEEQRIVRALTARLVERAPQVRADIAAAVAVDSFCARARLAEDLEASPPRIAAGSVLDLRQARHPTLLLHALECAQRAEPVAPVVANDIGLPAGSRVLVLSGPNAGGKTVALKTAGLCALMLRAGLPIPATPASQLSLFEQIFAVVGDQQSIGQHLSTFSAHVLAIDRIIAAVRDGRSRQTSALCLIDEIAQGTEPLQGAALAQSFLEALADLGALVIATTHYDRLKGLALDDARFRNAAVALDPQTLRPTFRLLPDTPGASSAFAIAAALGLQQPLIDRARELAGPQANRLEQQLDALGREREQLGRARAALDDERRRTESLRGQLEAERQRVADLERQLRQEARAELLGEVRSARRQVADTIARLQAGPPTLAQADRAAHALKELEQKVERRLEARAPGAPPLSEIKIGQRVHVVPLGQEGEVVELDGDGGVTVQCGPLRTRVERGELTAPRPRSSRDRTGRRSRHRGSRSSAAIVAGDSVETSTPRTDDNTLDLRGQRVEEALASCDRFFDQMTLREIDRVFLLHGHGTGALKAALRAELKLSRYVKRLAPAAEEDGGDAFTVVELK